MNYSIKNLGGLQTIFAPMQDCNTTTIQFLAKAGSIYETKKTNGLSHFLEHMFFKGGKQFTTPKSVAETIDSFGAECNAFTGSEYAGYYVKCAPEYTKKALEVLADMLVDAQFPDEEMQREKQVILQEISMYKDNPQRRVWSKRSERYKGDNSYGRPILGSPENVMSFTREDLFAHKDYLYAKSNIICIVAGSIPNQDDLEEMIGELFSRLPETSTIKEPSLPTYSPIERQASISQETQQNHLIISSPGFSVHQEERYAANIVAKILGGGMSSRLFQNIREKKGLCYSIRATHNDSNHDGTFLIKAGIEKERRDEGLAAIFDEIRSVVDGSITQHEFQKALGGVTGSTKMGIETSDQLADFVGYQYLFKKEIRDLNSILASYQNITFDQIQNVAKKLSKENLWSFWIE